MEWIKDQIEWLDSVSKESASRLAEKICIGSKRLAERVWNEGNETVRKMGMESDKKQL